jgi:hypothetical protein
VDQALFQADQLLTQTPSHAPRRIVLLTDGLTRQSLTPERLRGSLGISGALVHVGLLEDGAPRLERDDDHAWAHAVRSSGGLVWQASAPARPPIALPDREELERVYEEWARPLRIDRISAFSDNHRLADNLSLESLAEGEGNSQLYVDATSTRTLSLSGELWAKTVRVVAEASEARQRQWAALVFGSETLHELNESEMMTLALKGHAVSPVTSYLAIEPGVRPSTEGLKDEERFGTGFGMGAASVRSGNTVVSGRAPYLDRQGFLEQRLQTELARCGGTPGSVWLDIETTLDEIVNVTSDTNGSAPPVVSCMVEAAWALHLPPAFEEAWETFRVEL